MPSAVEGGWLPGQDFPARQRFRPGDMPPAFGDTAAALIVDDDDQVANVLERLLSKEGYATTIAGGAAEARRYLAAREFAVALVDILMPGESGLELASHMLAEHPDLAVIMVSGVDDPSIADLAHLGGAYGYIVKPFRANQVLITVSNAGYRRCLEIQRHLYEQRLLDLLAVNESALAEAQRLLRDVNGSAATS